MLTLTVEKSGDCTTIEMVIGGAEPVTVMSEEMHWRRLESGEMVNVIPAATWARTGEIMAMVQNEGARGRVPAMVNGPR